MTEQLHFCNFFERFMTTSAYLHMFLAIIEKVSYHGITRLKSQFFRLKHFYISHLFGEIRLELYHLPVICKRPDSSQSVFKRHEFSYSLYKCGPLAVAMRS